MVPQNYLTSITSKVMERQPSLYQNIKLDKINICTNGAPL
jgi:hypothetical protein